MLRAEKDYYEALAKNVRDPELMNLSKQYQKMDLMDHYDIMFRSWGEPEWEAKMTHDHSKGSEEGHESACEGIGGIRSRGCSIGHSTYTAI